VKTSTKPALVLRIPIEPCSASRPRVARGGWAYYPAKYKNFLKAAREAFKKVAVEPLVGGLRVIILVSSLRPRTTKLDFPKPDIDNFVKAVLDSGNEIVWADDSQIHTLTALKEWVPRDPSVRVAVYKERNPDAASLPDGPWVYDETGRSSNAS
jgi:Holliday junction resolvase RusA-like endonuclease